MNVIYSRNELYADGSSMNLKLTEWCISTKPHRADYLDSSVDRKSVLSQLSGPSSAQKFLFRVIEMIKLFSSQEKILILFGLGASEFQNLAGYLSI